MSLNFSASQQNNKQSSQQKRSSRRSSLYAQNSQNTDLILSPTKPPLTESKIKTCRRKAEDIATKMAEKSKDLQLSELILLQKNGAPNLVANVRNHDFNFLINHVISLATKVDQLQDQIDQEKTVVTTAQPGKLETTVCDTQYEIRTLKSKLKTLEMHMIQFTNVVEKQKSTLESAIREVASDLTLALERHALENLVRIGQCEAHCELLISAHQISKPTVIQMDRPAEATEAVHADVPAEGADDPAPVETNEALEEVFEILDDSMPPLEMDSQMEAEQKAAEAAEEARVEAELNRLALEKARDEYFAELEEMVSVIVDEVALRATEDAEIRHQKRGRRVRFTDPEPDLTPAPEVVELEDGEEPMPQVEKAEVEWFGLTKPGEYPEESLAERFDNHFSIILEGMKVPATVKKVNTVIKLEKQFAAEMIKSLYPAFHESCIKHIKSLRPPTQPRTKPYAIKVTFKTENARQHILAAACHAHLLIRPSISGKKLEQLKRDQKARYELQGTNQPGPAFLSHGGAAKLTRMHPSTEASMALWNKEYQRRKRYNREITVGGGGRPKRSMKYMEVNTPTNLNSRKWAERLNRDYQRHAMTQSVRDFFNGVRQQRQDGSRSLAAARTVPTATWGSTEPTTPSSTQATPQVWDPSQFQ